MITAHTNCEASVIYDLVDERGWNVLHFAMASLCRKELSSLLENPLMKKLVKEKDDKGNTPLHVLATCTKSMQALHNSFNSIISQVRANPSAVNKRNISAANTYNYGYPELKREIIALSEDIEDGPYVRGILRRKCIYLDEHFKQLKGAKESHMTAAALIATVTFAAAFTLPGGYKNEEGKHQGIAILSRNSAFQVFIITDAIAMVFSTSAVFIYVIMSLDMFKKYINLFELGAWITVVAMGAMVMAFVTGTYAVLAPLWLAIVTCFIGLSFFFFVLPVAYHIKILHIIRYNPWCMHKIRSIKDYLRVVPQQINQIAAMNSVVSNLKYETALISNNILEMDSLDFDQLFKAAADDLTRKILQKRESLTKEIDDNGWTPLHYAAYYGYQQVTRTLLEFGKSAAYIGDKYRKMTPLHLAISQGHIDITKEIILCCPDCYDLVDERGWNVLHFAMASLCRKELSSLLENPLMKKLVKEKDDKGNTPLHVLATCTRSMEALHNSFNSIISHVRVNPSAVNNRNISAANAYNYGYPELKHEIMALSEDIEDGPYVRGILRRKCNYLDEHFKQLKGAKESHLIAAALIATVTFAAAFTLPGGYKNEEGKHQGTAILSRNSAFQAFIITDAIAMVFSTSAVFIYVVMSLDMFKKYIHLFELGAWITVVAMGAMVMAFVTGTYAVLAPLWLAIVTCFIGLSFFFFVLPVAYHIKILHIIRDNPWCMHKIRLIKDYLRRPTMDSAASSSSNVEDISIGSTSHQSNVTIHETFDIIGPDDHHHRLLDAAAYGSLTRGIIENLKNLTNEKDDNGWTPLHCAAYYGRYEVMHILLEFDKSPAYVGDKYRKMTPLHLAASRGYLNMIRDMISYCPDCYELVDDRGWNCLHFAMATLNKDELFTLLQIPLIKKLLHVKNAKGNTPLHVLAAVTPYLTFSLDNVINKVGGDTNAVNQHNVNVADVFNLGCPNLKQEIIELSKHTGDGPYPQGVIGTKNILENRILELSGKAKDPHLVVATLILIVTFAAAFTLPGGYRSDEESKNQGTAILGRKSAFQTFVISDAIAMVFSMCAVFSYFIMSLEALPLKKYLTLFIITPWFVVISMAAMVIAFVTGTYAVLSPSLGLAIVTCLIGLTVFLVLGHVGMSLRSFSVCSNSKNQNSELNSKEVWNLEDEVAKVLEKGLALCLNFIGRKKRLLDIITKRDEMNDNRFRDLVRRLVFKNKAMG
ncbi:hypothetical protein EZV62_000766 [Acer yangbiense]|uniref:PGG domain-containing protein n=1 Tax=Acer yangbiense TaxID=1000413 RepID=A0A5C7IS02_9ROSI|nr:hypothetical protein EZV62_000766 [Acer yangbiense]